MHTVIFNSMLFSIFLEKKMYFDIFRCDRRLCTRNDSDLMKFVSVQDKYLEIIYGKKILVINLEKWGRDA